MSWTCKECGREIDSPLVSNGGYCSDGCRQKAEMREREEWLRKEKGKGKSTLKKWRKELEKAKKNIERLEEALEGDDPRAIAKARGKFGSGCLGKIIKIIILVILVFWISEKIKEAREASPSKSAAAEQTKVVDELPPLETNETTAPSEQLEQNVE